MTDSPPTHVTNDSTKNITNSTARGMANTSPMSCDTASGCSPAVMGGLAGVAAASVVMNVVMIIMIVTLSLLLAKKTKELKAYAANPTPSCAQHPDIGTQQNQAYAKTSNIPLSNNECYGMVPAALPIEERVEHPLPQQEVDYDYDVN